jgi:hypothetical protein
MALTMVLGLMGTAAMAGTWDFETDFSTNSNPNGPWSYRYKPASDTRDGNYTVLPGQYRPTSGVILTGWALDAAGTVPGVSKNFYATPQSSGSFTIGPGEAYVHPGNPGLVVVQWTAPVSGRYAVRYRFKDEDNGGTLPNSNGIKWYVDKGNSSVVSGSITNGGDTGECFAGPVLMNAGECLNFVVDRNVVSYFNDATRLQATITGGEPLLPVGAVTNVASAMYTLNDIYNVLDTRTTNVTRRTVVYAEPAGEPTNGTMHTLNEIMALVTNRAPVPKTGQTFSRGTGDDVALGIGVTWPNPRFTVGTGTDGTNCVTDNLTGLMWAQNAGLYNPAGKVTWLDALTVVSNYNTAVYGGYSDWRLPSMREIISLISCRWAFPAICDTAGAGRCNYGSYNPFINHGGPRWTSTAVAGGNGNSYWRMNTDTGAPEPGYYLGVDAYVWPVRGGQ